MGEGVRAGQVRRAAGRGRREHGGVELKDWVLTAGTGKGG